MAASSVVTGNESPRVAWTDQDHFEIDGVTFVAAGFRQAADADAFVVIKSPALVRRYLDLVAVERPRRIVELGIKDGGSTALLALVADPEVLVAVDLAAEPVPALMDLIAARGLDGSVVTQFGVDQSDRRVLLATVHAATHGQALDLVIDDASHLLGPTEASFDALFPLLRPGGAYVVEDWCADYHTAGMLAGVLDPDAPDFAQRLSRLRTLFAILNSPTAELPPDVLASITAAASESPDTEAAAGHDHDGPGRLLGRVAVRPAGARRARPCIVRPRRLCHRPLRLPATIMSVNRSGRPRPVVHRETGP